MRIVRAVPCISAVFLLVPGLLTGVAVRADPTPLAAEKIRPAIAGAVVHVDTPLSSVLKVTYGESGRLSGAAAGSLALYMGSSADQGRWWVEKGQLCHRWQRWFDAGRNCLHLRQDGPKLLWSRDDGETGTATIISQTVKPAEIAATPLPKPIPHFALAGPAQPAPVPPSPANVPITAAAAPAPVTSKPVAAASPPRPRVPVQPAFRVTGVASDDVLNMRAGPSQNQPVTGSIAANTRGLKLVGPCQGEWCPVRHLGVTGWVGGHFITREQLPGLAKK